MRSALPPWILIWFALDLALALLPPVHWAASGIGPFLGLPGVLVYLFGLSAFAAASVVAAYVAAPGAGR